MAIDETIRGPGCRCRVTHETLTRDENSHSLQNFCAGKYTNCPIWKREKEAILEKKRKQLETQIKGSIPVSQQSRPT